MKRSKRTAPVMAACAGIAVVSGCGGGGSTSAAPMRTAIVFVSERDGNPEIYSMNADGSRQRRLTSNAAQDISPALTPDGKRIVFSSNRSGAYVLYGMNLDGSDQKQVVPVGASAGSVLSRKSSRLSPSDPRFDREPSVSPNGRIVAFTSTRESTNGNVLDIYSAGLNGDGTDLKRLTASLGVDVEPVFSSTGKIAFTSTRDGNSEVYIMNSDGSSQTRLTTNGTGDFAPSFSPDGQRIVFASNRDGNDEIYSMNADGSGQTRLTRNPASDGKPVFSADRSKIVFSSDRDGNSEIYSMNLDGTNPTRLTRNAAQDTDPATVRPAAQQ